ncbi:YciI family protein [Nocardia concava]|uniref:YciI family protein n=1 Tax=Nocardia concava TaxID=257281 RepID=UPI0002F6A11F|nr:YciI family protein [Nocardia concava]
MAEYLVLIYQDERLGVDTLNDPSVTRAHEGFMAGNQQALRGGNALEYSHTATSIRPDGAGGFVVTDGPFAETKEQLGGYYVIEAADLDEAIARAQQVPMAQGGVEVRPIHAHQR